MRLCPQRVSCAPCWSVALCVGCNWAVDACLRFVGDFDVGLKRLSCVVETENLELAPGATRRRSHGRSGGPRRGPIRRGAGRRRLRKGTLPTTATLRSDGVRRSCGRWPVAARERCARAGGDAAAWGRGSVRAGGCGRVDGVARRRWNRAAGSRVVRDRCLNFLRACRLAWLPARHCAHRLEVARMGHRRVQRRHAVRSPRDRATRGRPAAEPYVEPAHRHRLPPQPPNQRPRGAPKKRRDRRAPADGRQDRPVRTGFEPVKIQESHGICADRHRHTDAHY